MWVWLMMGWMAMAGPTESEIAWRVVNDTVMGGVSSSQVAVDESLVFTGELSLESNGGFVSVRSRGVDPGLAQSEGLRVTLRGDGRTYDFTLERRDVRLRAGSYRMKVETTGTDQVVELPFANFRPTSYGRLVSGVPALDDAPEQVVEMGLLLADGNPGPFRVEVMSIEPYGTREPRGASYDAVLTALATAVEKGVPTYNAGDEQGCREMYATTLQSALEMRGLTDGERRIVGEALEVAADQGPAEAAWTLRYAIDSVLGGARS